MDMDTSIWQSVFNDTPPVLRWVITVLTLGLFALAGYIWRRQNARLDRHDERLSKLEDNERYWAERAEIREMVQHLDNKLDSGFKALHSRIDRLSDHGDSRR